MNTPAGTSTHSWFLRIFIPVTTIFLVTMVLLALGFSTLFTNVAQEIIADNFLGSLRMISTYYHQLRFSTIPIIDDLGDIAEIRDFLLANQPLERAAIGVYAKLENTVARNSYIHSIYLYNSQFGFYSSLNGLEGHTLSDSTLKSFLAQQPKNKHLYQRTSNFSHKTIPFSRPKEMEVLTNLYTICRLSYDSHGTLLSGIVLNLSETAARMLLSSDESNSMKNFYMIDEDFSIISHPDPSQFGKRVSGSSLLGQVALFEEREGSRIIKDGEGNSFLACWYDVGEMNWRLLFLLPMTYLKEPLATLRGNLVLLFVALAAIASIVLVLESKRMNNRLTMENRFTDFLRGGCDAHVLAPYPLSSMRMTLIHRQPIVRTSQLVPKETFLSCFVHYLKNDGKKGLLLQMEFDLFVHLGFESDKNLISQFKKLYIDLMDECGEHASILYSEKPIRLKTLPLLYGAMRKMLLDQRLVAPGFVKPAIQQWDGSKHVNLFLAETAELNKALVQKSSEAYSKAVVTFVDNLKAQDDHELFGAMTQYLSYSIVGLIDDVFASTDVLSAQEWKYLLVSSRGYEELREGLMVLSKILTQYTEEHSKRYNAELVQWIKDIVEEQLNDANLSATIIADRVNLSLGYTRNLFKSAEGMSINDYIGLKRIEQACILLETGSDPVNTIRERLGFSNTSYFCTYFKREIGMTPSEYRHRRNRIVQE